MSTAARANLVRALFAGSLALATGGCGGCQSETAPPPKPAAQQPAPAAQAPAAKAPAAPTAGGPDCFVMLDAEPDYGAPPLTVNFETEVECTGSPVTYSWDFGDGEKGANEPNPQHVYAKPGDYLATVQVTSPDGGSSDDEIDITVEEEAPGN